MKSRHWVLVLGSLFAATALGQATSGSAPSMPEHVDDGNYRGLDPMPSQNPHEPDAQWFHENTMVVRSGEFILDELPLQIRGGEKSYSASDGGFITYRGRFLTKNGRLYVSLRPFMSDYMIFPIGPKTCEPYSRVDIYPVKVTEKGFWIDGVLYQSQALNADRLNEFEGFLKSVPFEYDGKHPYSPKYRQPKCEPNDLSVLDE